MKRVAELERENAALKARVQHLEEELRLTIHRQFGKSSEQSPDQGELPFEDLEAGESPESIEAVMVAQHERRNKAGRKRLSDSLPRTEVFHDLSDAEKVCACDHTMTKIGEDVCEKLEMIPAQVWVARHHKAKYACQHCQGLADETKPAVREGVGPERLCS